VLINEKRKKGTEVARTVSILPVLRVEWFQVQVLRDFVGGIVESKNSPSNTFSYFFFFTFLSSTFPPKKSPNT